MRWYGNVMRREEQYMGKRLFDVEVEGKEEGQEEGGENACKQISERKE